MYPSDRHYTKDHEWIAVTGTTAQIGVTDYAQQQLGDVVFVELPEVGQTFDQGAQFGSIESVKAVSDLYSPVSGKVIKRNESLIDNPELVNEGPFEQGWMLKVEIKDCSELDNLLSVEDYNSFLKSGA